MTQPSNTPYPEPDADLLRHLLTGLPERPNTIRPLPNNRSY